jgi:L-lactate dehydrogenase complex protein LldE
VTLDFPQGQTCCGQPAFNSGFWSQAKPLARRFLKEFAGKPYIVVPSGSCAAMIRVFYPELFHDEPEMLALAQDTAGHVYEFSEFIVDVLRVEDVSPYCDADAQARSVTYHEACHLRRELGATTQARKLLRSLPGVELRELEQSDVCCGFGGTFSVKFPDISAAMLQDKIDDIQQTGADTVTACDCSCLMQIGGGLDRQGAPARPLHLAALLDERMKG